MRAPPRRLFLAAQIVAAALVLYFAGHALASQWSDLRTQPLAAHPRWWIIGVSSALVLGVYALLVQTWRVLLAEAGETLSFWRAAAIWSISNLWRYVPGKLWQIGAMSGLARREQVSAGAAAGAALLSTLLNIAAGLAIVLALGWRWIDVVGSGAKAIAVLLVAAAILGLAFLPYALRRFGGWVSRLSGRDVQLGAPPARTVVVATIGNLVAWVVYGLAFMWFVRGVIGDAPGPAWQYIAVYAASYVAGYLVLFAPGGIGAREGVMYVLLPALGLATPKQALLLAATSRVWLSLLEIAPGLLFLAYDFARRRSPAEPADVASKD